MREHAVLIVPLLLNAIAPCVPAQSISTASLRGAVRGDQGELLTDVRVQLINRATGHRIEIESRGGRFSVTTLEVGDPYLIIVRRLGYAVFTRDSLFFALGEPTQINVALVSSAQRLDTVSVLVGQTELSSGTRMGVGIRIDERLLHGLPTLNRDLYDFAPLVPEVSVRTGLISGGGMSPRYNNFFIDGVSQRHLQGSLPTGGFNGGKSLSMDAVREYEIILSAYDVRYGDFGGAMVNAVTRRGTNRTFATAFAYGRNERLVQTSAFLRTSPYQRLQYGFAVGGPLVKDRVHFFLAPEFQRLTAPAPGPYLGAEQPTGTLAPVTAADVNRFTSILARNGIDAGTAERVNVESPLANAFGRIDVLLPALRSRAVMWHNYGHVAIDRFDRSTPNVFPMSSLAWTQVIVTRASAFQLYTSWRGGALNELAAAYTDNPQRSVPRVRHPSITVTVTGPGSIGDVLLQAGTRDVAQGGGEQGQSSLEIADHFSFSVRTNHRFALGARAESFALRAPGVAGSYGSWEFQTLDALNRGEALRYIVNRGAAGATLRGVQYAVYAGDAWRATDRVDLTLGIRADALMLHSRPPYNAGIDAIYHRRTDEMPGSRVVLSPRAGFSWDLNGTIGGRLRGGAGVFAVRPPLAWLHAAFYSYGQSGTLRCGSRPSDQGPIPAFNPDYRSAPVTCADDTGFSAGPVYLVDRDLSVLAENARASLAYDRTLLLGFVGTLEGLYSRSLSDFLFVNLKLRGPQSIDRFGRVLYGTIPASGIAGPTVVAGRPLEGVDLDVRNQGRNGGYQLAARVERPGRRLTVNAGYALSRVRDVQSLAAAFPPANNWRDGRALSGRHESVRTGVSSFEVRHRVVLAAVARVPWAKRTDLSLYYIGESGSPFTYVATGTQGRGDLNADGSSGNDPIYVPRSAADATEIRFSGLAGGADSSSTAQAARVIAQQLAFERFIAATDCLHRQRGRIIERNSCRGPWLSTTNASIRQTLVVRGGQALAMRLEVFNLLNLVNRAWGQYRQPNAGILRHVAQSPSAGGGTEPVFQFDASMRKYSTDNIESGFQLQLALRYSF